MTRSRVAPWVLAAAAMFMAFLPSAFAATYPGMTSVSSSHLSVSGQSCDHDGGQSNNHSESDDNKICSENDPEEDEHPPDWSHAPGA